MDPWLIVWFVFLIGLSAIFSGSEIALMSLPMHKVDVFIKKRKSGAKLLQYIKQRSDRLLITILIGNNLVNVYTAAFATHVSISMAANMGIEASVAIGITTGVVTLLLLLFGEIAPKTLAIRYASSISLLVARFYYILMIVLYPLVISIDRLMRLFNKGSKKKLHTITDEEVEAIIDIGKKEGLFDADEYMQLKKMIRFSDTTVEEIMTPRIHIKGLKKTYTVDQAIEKALTIPHTRLPVYAESLDHIDTFVTLRELIGYTRKGKGSALLGELSLLPVIKVPLTQPINLALELFRKTRKHIAIVIDEYGGVAGLVSLEDIVEEVFGDIKDETDQEADAVRRTGPHQWTLDAHYMFDDSIEKIGLSLEDLDEQDHHNETMSYVIVENLGRLPKVGDTIVFALSHHEKWKSIRITVLAVEHDSVTRVSVELVMR